MVRMIRNIALAAALLPAVAAQAVEKPAGTLPAGTEVRLTSGWIETGTWFTGTVDSSGGCAVIRLQQPAAGGYDQIALPVVHRLQRADAGQWSEVAIPEWLAGEPAECRIGRAD